MKNWFTFTSVILLFLASCSSEVAKSEDDSTAKTSKKLNATQVAKVDISGMVCVMGCGSEIRKNLKATNAVASCDFDFEDGREINTASILFDPSKISESKIKSIIENLNEHQFTVVHSSSQKAEQGNGSVESSSKDGKEYAPVSMSEKSWKFPNVLDLLSSIVM
jgi:copper chaperone CopZ